MPQLEKVVWGSGNLSAGYKGSTFKRFQVPQRFHIKFQVPQGSTLKRFHIPEASHKGSTFQVKVCRFHIKIQKVHKFPHQGSKISEYFR